MKKSHHHKNEIKEKKDMPKSMANTFSNFSQQINGYGVKSKPGAGTRHINYRQIK